jgi:acetyl esterase/lipase
VNNNPKEIAYAEQSEAQKLDLYLPSSVSDPCPVIIWLHPGGYTTGDKEWVVPILDDILDRGYAVASMNYRLADEARFPAQIFDAKAAVRWTRANAATYNLNKEAIAAWGVSAGSTFAALLGTTANISELEDLSMGNPEEPSHVNAVVDLIGPMDFLQMNSQLLELGYQPLRDDVASGISMLLGGQLAECSEKCQAINPATYITSDCPPFYLQHGTADHLVPYLQSVNFARALADAIGQENVTLNLIEGVDHFDSDHNSSENVNKALDFLDRYLKHQLDSQTT